MGHIISKIKEPLHLATESVSQLIRNRKRKLEEQDSSDDVTSVLEKSLQEPKRKRLLTTTQYIYQALFKEQKNSDVTVMALGKTWHLHKVYLCQSPYFYSMFNGSWKESCQDFVHIKILDLKITIESLDAVFGSLYLDEIVIEPLSVMSVLATATLFQLEGLIDKCAEVMVETTNAETAIPYYEAGCQYGVQSVKKAAFDWLLANLLCFYNKHVKWLKLINCELMTDLVSSPYLYVMQTEFSLYVLLRLWLFLKLHPDYEPNSHNNSSTNDNNNSNSNNIPKVSSFSSSSKITLSNINPQTYFSSRIDTTPFLLKYDGYEFRKAFKALRIQHLLNHHIDLKLIIEDNIIPKEWLHHHLLEHWNSILKIDHAADIGPGDVDNDTFLKYSLRCGRLLPEYGYHKWRWTGFNFGLDIVLIVDEKTFSIKRHHKADNERLLSLRMKRQFLIRVVVASLNEQRQIIRTQTTEIKSLCLEKNEEQALMLLDKELTYPLLVSVNLLYVLPDKKFQYQCIYDPNEGTSSHIPISEIGANVESASIINESESNLFV